MRHDALGLTAVVPAVLLGGAVHVLSDQLPVPVGSLHQAYRAMQGVRLLLLR